jgi:hypothetical protein
VTSSGYDFPALFLVIARSFPIFIIDSVDSDAFDMKRLYTVFVASLILAIPAFGGNSLIASDGGGGSRHNGQHSSVGGGSASDIPISLVHYILEAAAPQFGVTPKFLKRQYFGGNVVIAQIGPNVYAVTYGGITIQILIESGSTDRGDLSIGIRGVRY